MITKDKKVLWKYVDLKKKIEGLDRTLKTRERRIQMIFKDTKVLRVYVDFKEKI